MNTLSGPFGLNLSDNAKKLAVWNKAVIIQRLDIDPSVWRYDAYGNIIKFSDYGDRNSKHGWEMDHHPTPAVFGGSDEIANLRPLHHTANARHGGFLSALFSAQKNN